MDGRGVLEIESDGCVGTTHFLPMLSQLTVSLSVTIAIVVFGEIPVACLCRGGEKLGGSGCATGPTRSCAGQGGGHV
jgi:hypothetical protein